MTAEQFNLLSDWDKDRLLMAGGVKVACLREGDKEVFLCQLHDFYVELCYSIPQQLFSGLYAFALPELPAKFLNAVDLSEISRVLG